MSENSNIEPASKSEEIKAFLIITFILFPMLAIGIVGTYGFIVWISQMLIGPPSA